MPDKNANLSFGEFLKFWRSVSGLSQEALGESVDSSTRHISRLERQENRPSEAMVLELARALELGERDRNHFLISAGFAPLEQHVDFMDDELAWLRKAMVLSLRALDPYPATLLDSSSNLLMVNRGWVAFYSQVISAQELEGVGNHYDFLFSDLMTGSVLANWQDTLSVVLMSLKQTSLLTRKSADAELFERLSGNANAPLDWVQRARGLEPRASYRLQMALQGKVHNFISVNTNVGAIGPAAYASEPHLYISALLPEDDKAEVEWQCHDGLRHPLLFY